MVMTVEKSAVQKARCAPTDSREPEDLGYQP